MLGVLLGASRVRLGTVWSLSYAHRLPLGAILAAALTSQVLEFPCLQQPNAADDEPQPPCEPLIAIGQLGGSSRPAGDCWGHGRGEAARSLAADSNTIDYTVHLIMTKAIIYMYILYKNISDVGN